MVQENKPPNSFREKIKFVPKPMTSLFFFIGLGVMFYLFQGRKYNFFRSDLLLAWMPDFYQHISNLSISFILYAGIGYIWLMMGVRFVYVIVFGIVLFAANLIYELFIPILNTPDILDAYFGFAGTALGFWFLLWVHKFGLKENPASY